ncbi:MAG: PAS domain S-box protein [Alphaproteobacteria bacterium]|nr:PAS domain S-box protein [Alphaproteobacteria bacterium]
MEWLTSSWHRLILGVTVLYILATGAFLAVALTFLRSEAVDSGERMLRALARVAADQSERSLQNTGQVLLMIRSMLVRHGATEAASDPATQQAIRDLLVDRPFLRSFWILNAEGRIVFNSSGRYEGRDVSHRPFFRHHVEQPDSDFGIHLPVRSPDTGEWYMTLSRPLRDADGRPAGVIIATLQRTYFDRVWSIREIGDTTSVALFHTSGRMMMRSPYVESAMGKSFADTSLFRKLLRESSAGTYQNGGIVDGLPRLLSYRRLNLYPNLVVVVGQTVGQIVAPWRRQAWIASLSWAISSAAAIGGVLALLRILRSSERRLERVRATNQRIFDTSVDLILVSDRKGNIVQVSPSAFAILGYHPEEMEGHNAIEFVHPADLEGTRNEMRAARRLRSLRRFDCRYIAKDGRPVVMSWAGQWSEADGQHYFIGRDVTERLSLEQQLRQAQKMEAIGQLTGGIAHDFNNLLTVVLGNAELLSDTLARDPERKELADLVVTAALRGSDLTRSLLAFARKQPLDPKVIDVNELVAGTEGLLRRMIGEQIHVERKLAAGIWPTMVDASQLETALLNLAVNARDAMPDGGRLSIETANVELDEDYARHNPGANAGAYVMLAVGDTGTGMPPEVAARAFEPFFTTKGVGKGTGLGLSMVYGFIKQSNGHIKVYSELGYGTTVKMYLPRASESEGAEEDGSGDAALVGGHETVLVVEDDGMVRAYALRQLQSLGYRVIEACNGSDALERLRETGRVDLLFTDVVMPGGLNGRQLAAEVRRILPDVKVLYTSGYTENAIVHQGRLDPGVELLNKPYRRADLARKLRKVLDAPARPPDEASREARGASEG